MPMILVLPIFTLGVLVFVAGNQAFMFVYLYTAAEPIVDDAGVVTWKSDGYIFWMQFYFYFGKLLF